MKKFAYVAPLSSLDSIHSNRPYFEIPRAISKLGWQSTLIAGVSKCDPTEGVILRETGIGTNRHLDIFKVYRKLRLMFKSEKYDIIVFFHMNLLIVLFVFMGKIDRIFGNSYTKVKTKWIIKLDWDGSNFQDLSIFFMKVRNFLLSVNSFFVDSIVAENSCSLHKASEIPLIRRQKLRLIPNSYSHRFGKIPYNNGKREEVILCVARISPEKGIENLVRSFLNLSSRYSTWNLKFVGPIEDSDYYSKMIEFISNNNLENRILFCGEAYDKALIDYYESASIFCLPSTYESFGIVRAEAIAKGLPVITTEAGCGRDFEKYGSFIIPIDRNDLLEETLSKLMGDELLRENISMLQQDTFPTYDKIAEMLLE